MTVTPASLRNTVERREEQRLVQRHGQRSPFPEPLMCRNRVASQRRNDSQPTGHAAPGHPCHSKGQPLNSERGAWESPPAPWAAASRPGCLLKPDSALQGALTSGQRLSLSSKSQPYFLLTEDSRESAIHRRGDPDGLGGGGCP